MCHADGDPGAHVLHRRVVLPRQAEEGVLQAGFRGDVQVLAPADTFEVVQGLHRVGEPVVAAVGLHVELPGGLRFEIVDRVPRYMSNEYFMNPDERGPDKCPFSVVGYY